MNTTVFEKLCFSFFDSVSAVLIGACDPSEGFDLNGLIQALALVHFPDPHGGWVVDLREVLSNLHMLGRTWQDWTVQCKERFCSWIASLQEIFAFFRIPLTEVDILNFSAKYSVAALADLGEDFLKYQTNWLACRLFRQTEYPVRPPGLPENEVDGFIFPSTHRFLLHRVRSAKERLQLGYSLIQFKRGCKPVSEPKRLKALAKHAKALGRVGKDRKDLRSLIREVKRTVREVLGSPLEDDEERLLPPSTSAHYSLTRAGYGALPRMQELTQDHVKCADHTPFTGSLFDCACHQWLLADSSEGPRPVVPWGSVSSTYYYAAMRGYEPSQTTFMDQEMVHFERPQPPKDIKEKVLVGEVFESERDQSACEVHLVLEPFKVRTITAGDATFGWLGRFWQKKIHARVGSHPIFEYTHHPVSFGSIRAAFGSVPSQHKIVSGDYEAATDNLEMELTKAAWEECCNWLYPDDLNRRTAREIGFSMLSGQNLHYLRSAMKVMGVKSPHRLDELQEQELVERLASFGVSVSVEQTQGQLMGCILSFFLLCMINATTLRVAYENVTKKRIRLNQMPARINGDDILFHATDCVIEEWKRTALECGLKPSLGKNFVSREFGMINSELYRFEERGLNIHRYDQVSPYMGFVGLDDEHYMTFDQLEPTEFVPYVNLGLLTGMGRVQEDSRLDRKFLFGDDRTESVGARAKAMVRGFSETKSRYLISRLLTLNQDILLSTTRGWGLPEALGGLGIPYVDNHSREGLVVAAYLNRCDPVTYKREIAAIKGVELNPPPHVVAALDLQVKVLRRCAVKRWGTEDEAKRAQLPLLVGATWLNCRIDSSESRRVMDPESAYRRLVRTAVKSGVPAMESDFLSSLSGKVIVHDFDPKVITQMEAWIPSISRRVLN